MESENIVTPENNTDKKKSDTYSLRCGSEYAELLREASKNYANKTEFAKAIINGLNNSNDSVSNENEAKIQRLNERISELENQQTHYSEHAVFDGHILVPCDKFELRCLEYLMAREREYLGNENITPGHVYQYVLRSWFIKGSRMSLDSIPNSQLTKIRERLERGNI